MKFEIVTIGKKFISEDGKKYHAFGLTKNEMPYRLSWDITNFETENKDEACDWDSPISVVLEEGYEDYEDRIHYLRTHAYSTRFSENGIVY